MNLDNSCEEKSCPLLFLPKCLEELLTHTPEEDDEIRRFEETEERKLSKYINLAFDIGINHHHVSLEDLRTIKKIIEGYRLDKKNV